MKTIHSNRLTFKSGTSDKEYRIALMEITSTQFDVCVSYGRRGGTLASGCKGSYSTIELAEKTYQKVLKEKLAKGYIIDVSSSPSVIPKSIVRKEALATSVQLLKDVDEDFMLKVLNSKEYVVQEKKDGERRTINKTKSSIYGGNKKGEIVEVSEAIKQSLDNFEDIELDGELVGDKYYVFDLLRFNGKDFKLLDYRERLIQLTKLGLKFGMNIDIVETAWSISEKLAVYEHLKTTNAEGIVLKSITGQYKPGRSISLAFKYKFYKTATIKVSEITTGKRSVQMSILDHGKFINIGAVTIPPNKDMPLVGDYLEVRYLYAYKGGCLFQPTFLFLRNDVDDTDCGISQIIYKKEESDNTAMTIYDLF